MSSPLPFEGLRVIDLGSFWAAPYLTSYLGAYGADVIKVESTQRPDGFRFTATDPALGDAWYERSLMWQATNLNKRSLTLDLGADEGKRLLSELCAEADVFVENYAARVVEQFGFDYESLRKINPSMVVMRLPGFGLTGPWRDFVGWGNAFEQLAGLAWVTGYPDGQPKTPGGYIDPTVGMHAAVALMAALEHRDRTREGQLVEVAQIEVGASMSAPQVIAESISGVAPGRIGNRAGAYAPQGVYRCADETTSLVAVSVRHDEEWKALLTVMGHPEALADAAYNTFPGRASHHDELDEAIQSWFSEQSCDDVLDALQAAGIPAAKVLTADGFNEDPQLVSRSFYQEVEHPLSGPRLFPRYPMQFSFEAPMGPHRAPAPLLGQHNNQVLGDELGLTEAELRELRDANVVGTVPAGLAT
jgi:crotonobetainyl-CoA:carnitine CoA-transferase CaiB-like acyl-CoA transferase